MHPGPPNRLLTARPSALLLLAAGASSRLGQPKQLLLYQGQTLLRRAAETAAASGCWPLLLITGCQHDKLLPEVAGLPFEIIRNENWAEGLSSSIRAGMAALAELPAFDKPEPAAVLLMLCDQPLLMAAHLRQLIALQHETRSPAVASTYAGTAGVPVVFGPTLFEQLRTLAGPTGARQLLAQLPLNQVLTVDFPAGAVDVDTPAHYQQLLAGGA